jgi:hypothetical protein
MANCEKATRTVFELTLEDHPPLTWTWPAAPAPVRLRRLLKTLLRCHGFRCLAVRELGGGLGAKSATGCAFPDGVGPGAPGRPAAVVDAKQGTPEGHD